MVATAVKTERRDLAMHPKLLMDTIKRQAGTLQKANLEGVMNAIEAGSPVVRINLDIDDNGKASLSIGDDGIGIETKEELIKHFETFGTPHEAYENTQWKQFRMGRGQMFAFGKNIWRTSTFKMVVDIDNEGLTYDLTENLPHVTGCQIDIALYQNPIGFGRSYGSVEQYKEAIQKQVRFMEGTILFNGEQINTPASRCKWDFQDDNAYYLFNVGSDFKIYNLGAFVMDASLSETGMMGVVVSKKQVKVNFARNDIQHDCKVYFGYTDDNGKKVSGIIDVVKDNRIKRTRSARRVLTSWERQSTLKDLRDGNQSLEDVSSLALIPTAQGKYVSLDFVRKNKQQWCFAPSGSDIADRLMERDQALCFSQSLLTDLNHTGHKALFFSWLIKTNSNKNNNIYGANLREWEAVEKLYRDFKEIADTVSDSYSTLPDKKLTTVERRILKILNSLGCWNGRVISIGSSERANAWTDGSTYITIDKGYINRLCLGYSVHCNRLMTLMAHEMAHDCDTRGTHVHGPEFYENMCEILRSDSSPTVYNCHFREKMERGKLEEKRDKIRLKKEKQDRQSLEKLGIAASSK